MEKEGTERKGMERKGEEKKGKERKGKEKKGTERKGEERKEKKGTERKGKGRKGTERTQDTGHGTRDTGHGTRDTGHGTRDTGHGTRDTGHGTRDTPEQQEQDTQTSQGVYPEDNASRAHSFARTTRHARHGHGTRNTISRLGDHKGSILPTSDNAYATIHTTQAKNAGENRAERGQCAKTQVVRV